MIIVTFRRYLRRGTGRNYMAMLSPRKSNLTHHLQDSECAGWRSSPCVVTGPAVGRMKSRDCGGYHTRRGEHRSRWLFSFRRWWHQLSPTTEDLLSPVVAN